MSPNTLQGQIALITGGGRGLGRAIAMELTRAGVSVAVTARSADQLAETVNLVESAGGAAIAITADVTDPVAVQACVARVVDRLGPIDLLVNSAGRLGKPGPIWEADLDEWWSTMEVNVRGVLNCIKAVVPGMIARGSGKIFNLVSTAGTIAIPYGAPYCASKAAQIRFTDCMAADLKPHGISLFAVDPGTVESQMTRDLLNSEAGQKYMPWLADMFKNNLLEPEESIGKLVRMLAEQSVDFLSGRFLQVANNIDDLTQRADQIVKDDLYTMRLRA